MRKFILLVFLPFFTQGQELTEQETQLYQLITQYRAEKGLPAIPLSKSLTFVAQTHVRDLVNNQPDQGTCNLHSWSNRGSWQSCCYTSDHAQANCMWSKPRELTSYTGNGYEISCWYSDSISAQEALDLWKSSSGHNAVIINEGIWATSNWKAIGVGVLNGYAVIWFGELEDQQ